MNSTIQLFFCFCNPSKRVCLGNLKKISEDLIIYNDNLAIVKKNDKAFQFSGLERGLL